MLKNLATNSLESLLGGFSKQALGIKDSADRAADAADRAAEAARTAATACALIIFFIIFPILLFIGVHLFRKDTTPSECAALCPTRSELFSPDLRGPEAHGASGDAKRSAFGSSDSCVRSQT